ncbi:MAG: outer membrane protein assembly factor [Thermodesulfovibrionales bacterium]
MTPERVRVEGLHSIEREELLGLLGIAAGRPLGPAELRRGIKRAFLKGIFDDIAVSTSEEEPGTLVVSVRERDFIDDIDVRGNDDIPDKFIYAHLDLKERTVIRYDLLESVKKKLLEALRERGYPEAAVDIEVSGAGEPYRVDVLVKVTQGRPDRVYRIEVVGQPEWEVKPYMRTSEGDIYDQFRLREDLERLRRRFQGLGFLSPVAGPYTFSDGTLVVSVTPGRRLEIEIKGNEAVADRKLRAVMPFLEAGDVRDDLIEEAVSKMTDLYHEAGFPFVQIAPVLVEQEEVVEVSFFVYEGDKVLVDAINVEGISVSEGSVKEIMSLKEGGAFNPDVLESDVDRIRELLNALGYVDASVSEPRVEVSGKWATIGIDVVEGPKYVISHINVEGVRSVSGEEVFQAMELKAGVPYNEVDIADARRRISTFYRTRGYLDASVGVSREFENSSARVIFQVDEGPRYFFGDTVIIGNTRTRPGVISRELPYEKGSPLDASLLYESRQGLYRLGIFREVDVRTLESYDHTSDIAVEVDEAKPGTIEFGFGYGDYEGLRGFFDIGYRNLFGLHRQASFRTELSSLSRRFILNYREPWFLGRRMPMRAFLLREERKEENIDTGEVRYRVRRTSANVGIERNLGRRTKLDLAYEYSLVETFDVKPDVVLSREDTGTLAISSIIPSVAYDTRDNPFDPKRGVFAGGSLKVASNFLLSETDFLKAQAHASTYIRLSRPLVLALGARGGVAQGLRDTSELPLVERFFLGGRNSVRGFAQDTLGPKGAEGTPLGGNAFLQGNVELRMRVAKSWRVVAFVDAGNVWLKIDEVDPLDLRYAAGLGLRYDTPVGPVRVDYGLKVDPEPGESSGEIHFSIGHAF